MDIISLGRIILDRSNVFIRELRKGEIPDEVASSPKIRYFPLGFTR